MKKFIISSRSVYENQVKLSEILNPPAVLLRVKPASCACSLHIDWLINVLCKLLDWLYLVSRFRLIEWDMFWYRTGGCENVFHCFKCGCCYSTQMKNSHPCVEGAMHHDCPICFEYLFESVNDVLVLPCGHTIHKSCLNEMGEHFQYACPLCSKSVCDMSMIWEKFDLQIAATPMPEAYRNKMIWILCNDCTKTSHVQFHLVAQKCLNCKSYNTRQIRGWGNALHVGVFISTTGRPKHMQEKYCLSCGSPVMMLGAN